MQLYAIRYGVGFRYGTEGTVMLGAKNPEQIIEDFPFFYYLAKLEDEVILVDTGFRDEKLAKDMGVTLLPVQREIEFLFGKDLIIDKVIVTHSHWDHVGNLDLYPDAELVMTKETYQQMQNKGNFKKICIMNSGESIGNKFVLTLVGGHTKDSAAILFEKNNQTYCITGDECYLQDNMTKRIPIGICENKEKNRAFIERGYCEKWIPLPFHDKSLIEKYMRCTENIVRIM